MESLFQAFAWKAAEAGSGGQPDSRPLCQPVLPAWHSEDLRLFPSVASREFCWTVTCSPLGIFIVQYICSHGWGGSSAAPTHKAKLAWECAFLRLFKCSFLSFWHSTCEYSSRNVFPLVFFKFQWKPFWKQDQTFHFRVSNAEMIAASYWLLKLTADQNVIHPLKWKHIAVLGWAGERSSRAGRAAVPHSRSVALSPARGSQGSAPWAVPIKASQMAPLLPWLAWLSAVRRNKDTFWRMKILKMQNFSCLPGFLFPESLFRSLGVSVCC